MRDINRIDLILNELGEVWKRFPDLRLGQLLLNVVPDPALYYIEDKELLANIKKFYPTTNVDNTDKYTDQYIF